MDFLNSTETDVAYHILLKKGQPIHYRELITEVIEKKQKHVQSMSAAISEVYTLINMDSRFHYMGKSLWGLSEWNPPETKRASRASSTSSRSAGKSTRRREKLLEGIQEE